MLNGLCNRLSIYARLIRIDKPVGIFLLLWPTLWALWMASEGLPDAKIFLFTCSVLFNAFRGVRDQ